MVDGPIMLLRSGYGSMLSSALCYGTLRAGHWRGDNDIHSVAQGCPEIQSILVCNEPLAMRMSSETRRPRERGKHLQSQMRGREALGFDPGRSWRTSRLSRETRRWCGVRVFSAYAAWPALSRHCGGPVPVGPSGRRWLRRGKTSPVSGLIGNGGAHTASRRRTRLGTLDWARAESLPQGAAVLWIPGTSWLHATSCPVSTGGSNLRSAKVLESR